MQENMGKVYKTEFLNICSRNQTLTELKKKKLLLILRPMMKQMLKFTKKALFFCCKQESSVKGELYKMPKEKRELYVNECILIKCKY